MRDDKRPVSVLRLSEQCTRPNASTFCRSGLGDSKSPNHYIRMHEYAVLQ